MLSATGVVSTLTENIGAAQGAAARAHHHHNIALQQHAALSHPHTVILPLLQPACVLLSLRPVLG
jgi:hypothetical protein